jgi:hypothetical protein
MAWHANALDAADTDRGDCKAALLGLYYLQVWASARVQIEVNELDLGGRALHKSTQYTRYTDRGPPEHNVSSTGVNIRLN